MLHFGWQTWLVHVFMSIAVMSGYMAVYNVLWRMTFGDNARDNVYVYRLARPAIILLPISGVLLLAYACYVDPMNDFYYRNLQLLMLGLMMLDDRLSLTEFVARVGIMFTYIAIEDVVLQLNALAMTVSLVTVLAEGIYIRRHQELAHYSYWRIFMLGLVMDSGYWLLRPNIARINAIAAVVTHVIMLSFCFVLWSEQHNADLERRKLQHRAEVDTLTGVKTYARFRDDSERLIAEADRLDQPLTMAMLDIDHFKSANDEFGHLAGNAVLVGMAELLNQVLQKHGVEYSLYRTGGEEFNIVFTQADANVVRTVMTDCWRAVRTHEFMYEQQAIKVTISVGIVMHRAGEPADDMYKRADANLYLSKRRGRDTITIEGTTERLSERQIASYTFAFFTQPIVRLGDGATQRNELLLRGFNEATNQWGVPATFDVTVPTRIALVKRALIGQVVRKISMNIRPAQFVQEATAIQLGALIQTGQVDQLILEMSELPDLAAFIRAVPWYRMRGIGLAIDNVDGVTAPDDITEYLQYFDGIKFALDHEQTREHNAKRIRYWLGMAQMYDTIFTLEGVSTAREVVLAKELGISRGQGDYFARPTMPQLR